MRLLSVCALLTSLALVCADEKPGDADLRAALITIRKAAENEIAADKMYKGQGLLVELLVVRIGRGADGYTLFAAHGATGRPGPVLGELKIKKGAEEPFAPCKPGDALLVRAKYTGFAARPADAGVVQFSDAEFVKPIPHIAAAPTPKDK
jgi:hypothetical protein